MKAANRTKHLMLLLGWQGGTIHDACNEVGLSVNEFLYNGADFYNGGPTHAFVRGFDDVGTLLSNNMPMPIAANSGNLEYWLGAVSAVHNSAYECMQRLNQ